MWSNVLKTPTLYGILILHHNVACCPRNHICFFICLRTCGFPTSKKKISGLACHFWHKISIHPTHTTPRGKIKWTAWPHLELLHLHLGFFHYFLFAASNFTFFRSLPKRWRSKTRSSLLTSPMTPRFHLKWRSIMIRYVCLFLHVQIDACGI